MAKLKVGSKAPDFTLPTGDGKTISLKDFRGKRVILYFYPKDDTSGCTKEACSFRDNITKVVKRDAVVIGISTDTPESHKKFSEKYGLPFALGSDPTKEVVRAYGVWKKKSLYGRSYMGTERTTFVINERGVITTIFEKVKVDGHTDEVLAAL
jgi:thioredoxin-dependent peroxiredoxin